MDSGKRFVSIICQIFYDVMVKQFKERNSCFFLLFNWYLISRSVTRINLISFLCSIANLNNTFPLTSAVHTTLQKRNKR